MTHDILLFVGWWLVCVSGKFYEARVGGDADVQSWCIGRIDEE
jgi:hypothetical protein